MATGYKTENRKRILEYLESSGDKAVSVKDIHDYLCENGCSVNLSTIYRFLDKLEKEGSVITYISEKGDKATYQYVGDQAHCSDHLHLKCVKCGKIIHLDCNFMGDIAGHIEEHHDFTIQCRNSVIYGVCKECQKKK